MSGIELVGLDRSSVRAIMPVMDAAFAPEFAEAWTLEQCEATLLIPGAKVAAAFQGDKIVGFAFWLTVVENSELLLLAVMPQLRGQGLGRLLLDEWIQQSRSDKVKQLFLEVRETNEALEFYRLSGFDVIGKRPNYYKLPDGNNLSALTMKKSLD